MFSKDKKAREGIEEIGKRFDELEHDFKMLKLEWEESYEKIASMLRKLARRAQVLQEEDSGGKPPLSPEELAIQRMQHPGPTGPDSETRRQAMEIVMKRRGGLR